MKRTYWANPGGDIGLRNGSFIRTNSRGELCQWMNGDFMGVLAKVPKGFTEVTQEHAEKLIPKVCGV